MKNVTTINVLRIVQMCVSKPAKIPLLNLLKYDE